MKHDRRLSIQAFPGNSALAAATCELSPNDALFARLDGQQIRGDGRVWRAEVVAIHMSGDAAWVQIGPERQPDRGVVLRLSDPAQAQLALDALQAWASLPEELRPRVIDLSDNFA